MGLHMVKGDSVKEQIAWIDRYLHHTKSRLQKKVIMGVSPIPVSGYCSMPESDGSFFRYMIPVSGSVKRVMFDVVGVVAKGMTVTVTLFRMTGDQVRSTNVIRTNRMAVNLDWPVSAGDKVKARFDGWGALSEPDKDGKVAAQISEVWIAFALYPNREESQFILEDIPDEGISD